MKRSPIMFALVSATLLAAAAPGLAAPFQNGQAPTDFEHVDVNRQNDRHEPMHGPAHHLLDLAGKLAAAETYVGITGEQENAWRTYSAALIDLLDRPAPEQENRGPDQRRAAPGTAVDGPEGSRPPRLFAEGLADHAIERGEKAKALKAAVEALRSSLSEEQLARLARAEREFAPGPLGPEGGPDGRHGPHHDGGERRAPQWHSDED